MTEKRDEVWFANHICNLVRESTGCVEECETFEMAPESIPPNEFVIHTYDEDCPHLRVTVEKCNPEGRSETDRTPPKCQECNCYHWPQAACPARKKWRCKWSLCPHINHTSRITFIEAVDAKSAKAVLKQHIEVTQQSDWFSIFEVKEYVDPVGGKVVS